MWGRLLMASGQCLLTYFLQVSFMYHTFMEDKNKRKIQGNYKELVSSVRPCDIQDHLVRAGMLSDEEEEWITLPSISFQEGWYDYDKSRS